MHRVARELAHQECGWKHSEGHGVVALDYEGVRHVGLDKMCLLMEVGKRTPLPVRIFCPQTRAVVPPIYYYAVCYRLTVIVPFMSGCISQW
jgi:hypothetical protein